MKKHFRYLKRLLYGTAYLYIHPCDICTVSRLLLYCKTPLTVSIDNQKGNKEVDKFWINYKERLSNLISHFFTRHLLAWLSYNFTYTSQYQIWSCILKLWKLFLISSDLILMIYAFLMYVISSLPSRDFIVFWIGSLFSFSKCFTAQAKGTLISILLYLGILAADLIIIL